MRRAVSRRRGERGTAMLLFPAGILVVLLLSAIAVDLSMVHAAQRSLRRAVDAAADDAAAQIDLDLLYRDGVIEADLAAARRSVQLDLADADLVGGARPRASVEAGPRPRSLRVRATASVPRIFAAVIPGVPDRTEVVATVVAELREEP